MTGLNIDRRGLALLGAMVMIAGALAYVVAPSGASAPVSARSLVQTELSDGVHISTSGPSHVEITRLSIKPGASTIWHSHGQTVIVAVKRGTAAVYRAGDTGCTREEQQAGSGFLENPAEVHAVRNEGDGPLILNVIFVVPRGSELGAAATAPVGCTFAPLDRSAG